MLLTSHSVAICPFILHLCLQRFVAEQSGEDLLLHGFHGKNANPYRWCALLYCTVLHCTVSVLGREEGYTIIYTPLPEGVPEGEA